MISRGVTSRGSHGTVIAREVFYTRWFSAHRRSQVSNRSLLGDYGL